MTDRLLYVFVVTAPPLPNGDVVPPALMVFGRLPDAHELHAYVLRESPGSKASAATVMGMWQDIPPDMVVGLEDAAHAGKRAYIARKSNGLTSTLCVVANPHYPEPDRADKAQA